MNVPSTYHSKLLGLIEAGTKYHMKRKCFWAFRVKHGIPLLSGGLVHEDDIIAGFERERNAGRVGLVDTHNLIDLEQLSTPTENSASEVASGNVTAGTGPDKPETK